jgi:threonine/homoserine/homoserine lactone efflux protein
MIGVFSSIPVGPIAILCIQRTLHRGRYHGWFTGLGAALSDLAYASLAAFSMSFIINFIHQNQFYIEIIGALIILVFGFFIFKSNPMKQLSTVNEKKETYFKDFITSFMLTSTNPLMNFLFIGLFARFDFIQADSTLLKTILGLLSIFAGAAIWWFYPYFLCKYLSKEIQCACLWILNKIAGAIIIGIAIIGLFYSLTKDMYV